MSTEFLEFVRKEKWKDVDDHFRDISYELDSDIALLAKENGIIREQAREQILQTPEIELRCVSDDELKKAEDLLMSGEVMAVDGTHAIYKLLSGIRARIGVAATTYENQRTSGVVFVSEQQISGDDLSIIGILQRRQPTGKAISRMVVRAIMHYMERKIVIDRAEGWVMFNGPLVPYELRTGLGSFQAIDPCLKICESVLDSRHAIGVVADSQQDELLSLGLALNRGEYILWKGYYHQYMMKYLDESGLRSGQRDRMERFVDNYAADIELGVFRAGSKAYLIQARAGIFAEAVSLVMRDAMFQPIRGYPLLIDYADSLCTKLLAAGDFNRMVDIKLAKANCLEFEQNEHALRRR
jgi:hypothetical protein